MASYKHDNESQLIEYGARMRKERDEARAVITAIRERCLEHENHPVLGPNHNATERELGFFEGHSLAHRQIHELTWEVERDNRGSDT